MTTVDITAGGCLFRTNSDKVLLSAGVRYDNYNSFDSANPRASIIFQPTASSTLKLVYGEAYRAPNIYERYYNDGGNTALANPSLKPEKIRTYEAIWEQYFAANYNSSISGYYSRINNLISQILDPVSSLQIFRNFEKVDAKGIELALQGKWDDGLQGKVSYTWQETTFVDTGELLHNSPRHLAKVNVSIPFYNQKLFISPELQYTSPRHTIAGNRTKDPVLVNLTVYSRDLIKGFDASVSVYNIFDSSYADPGGPEHRQDSIRQDGINFRCKLSYRF
jgi:outer membrane receptor for ferrienterochelin and colicins